MPYTIGPLSNAKNDCSVIIRVSERYGPMRLSAKPGIAAIQAPTHVPAVVVQDDFFFITTTGEPGLYDFNLRFFEARRASVRYRNSPQHRRAEICRSGDRIDVAGFKFHLRRNPRLGLREACCRDREK